MSAARADGFKATYLPALIFLFCLTKFAIVPTLVLSRSIARAETIEVPAIGGRIIGGVMPGGRGGGGAGNPGGASEGGGGMPMGGGGGGD